MMKKRMLSLMTALVLCLGLLPGTAWAEELRENGKAHTTRATQLRLTSAEEENAAEGWSWKKTDEYGYDYTLTLDNVNFEVPDDTAITFSIRKDWLGKITIVLKGENRVVSTYQDDDNFYQTYGIRLDTSSNFPPGEILVTGGGSLTVEGYRCGIGLGTDKLHLKGVTVNAQSDYPSGLSVTNSGSLLIEDSTVNTNSISATGITSNNSDISVSLSSVPANWTYSDSLIAADSVNISGGTLTLSGSAERPAYCGIFNNKGSSASIDLRSCRIDIRNVKYGLHVNLGTINLTNIQGAVFCTESGTLLNSHNPAFHANRLNASECSIYAQTGEDIFIYGDCSLPSEITELTVPGDLKIETGKTFTIGEGQKVIFTKDSAKVSDTDNTTLINNGTLEFSKQPTFRGGTKLVNNGTLIAPEGISYSSTYGVAQNVQVTNNGFFDGLVKEHSGTIWYIYGNVTQESDRTLGGTGVWISKTFVTTGAVLTIPNGKTLDASRSENGLTWDTLNEHLSVEEGGKIVVVEEGQLLLPPDPTPEQLNSLPITGDGTVKAGDVLVCVVHFDNMGGSEVRSFNLLSGQTVVKPTAPTRDGYTFGGWYTDTGCTTAYNFSEPVTGNLTLYAKWNANPVEPDPPPVTPERPSDSDNTPTTYRPDVSQPDHGSVTVSPRNPQAGDKVTVKPVPDEGYEVDSVTVTDRKGWPVAVTEHQDGTYTFTQPQGTVTIEVELVPLAAAPWTSPYTDVTEERWYSEAVQFVTENGLMRGYDDHFAPGESLTRAQLAQVLYNCAGRPATEAIGFFDDVKSGAWYSQSVAWAVERGVVSGYGGGRFGPNDPITREQLAMMLWQYAGRPAPPNLLLPFRDADQISPWADHALRWAVDRGILKGKGGNVLDPRGTATRAETAQIIKNFLEK